MVNRHESIQSNEQLDEALDIFERDWSSDNLYLLNFVAKYDGVNQPQSLAELIRADIDRRYAAHLDVDLTGYLKTFPELRQDPDVLSAIAFEDYRSRRSRGLSLTPNRWLWIPSIESTGWFTELQKATSYPTNPDSLRPKPPTVITEGCNAPIDVSEVSTESPRTKEPSVGDRLGDFQLLAILGKGSFSTVFLAKQCGLASRYVALKVVRRPLDEPTHLARLQNTGIVPLFSLHRIGPYTLLCMPYFGSATLADWFSNADLSSRDGQSLVGTVQSAQMRLTTIDAGDENKTFHPLEIENVRVWNASGAQPLDKLRSLNPRQSILWLAQRLTAALAHAHERGVLHGDLKPANILIRNDGEPALIDFNLSKSVERGADSWAGGTLPYMSPEQLQMLLGQSSRIDASADIYALGIILFELVENRLPYPRPLSQAESDVKIALDSRKQVASMTNSSATSGLKAIISKCLSFSPHERYASAVTLLEDIEREIANRPLLHVQERLLFGRTPKLLRRYPRFFSSAPIALLSLFAITLLASVAIMGWNRSHRLDAQARLAHFRVESRILLAELIDPAPSQWKTLLGRLYRLTDDITGSKGTSTGDASKQPLENNLKWLSPSDRESAEDEFVEFCTAASALICSSAQDLQDFHREQLRQLLLGCSAMSRSPKTSIVLDMLLDLIRSDEQRLPNRYEALMCDLETQLDAHDVPREAPGLIELLQARSDIKQGQAHQAIERLKSIDIRQIPAHLYWLVSGDAQAQIDHPEAAIQAYGLAVGAAPKSVAAYVKRAQLLQSLRDHKSAEDDYSRAISLEPAVATLYMRRALIREERRDLVGAIQDMDAALALEPKSNRMLLVRARLHQLADHPVQHREDFRDALTITPKDVEDWTSRALAQLPRYPERAKTDLQAALRIEPMSIVALQNLAHVESEHLHDMEAAMSALDQILLWNAENESALSGRSVLQARFGRVQECLQDLDILAKRESRLLPSTLYQMGCAHALISKQSNKSVERALYLLAKAIRRGYGAEVIETDPDLELLRGHASFVALITVAQLFQAK